MSMFTSLSMHYLNLCLYLNLDLNQCVYVHVCYVYFDRYICIDIYLYFYFLSISMSLFYASMCVFIFTFTQYCFISIDIDPSTFDIYPYLPISVHGFYDTVSLLKRIHIDWPFLFTYTFSSIYFSALPTSVYILIYIHLCSSMSMYFCLISISKYFHFAFMLTINVCLQYAYGPTSVYLHSCCIFLSLSFLSISLQFIGYSVHLQGLVPIIDLWRCSKMLHQHDAKQKRCKLANRCQVLVETFLWDHTL